MLENYLENYLDTLERIPDDVLLSALTRDLDLNEPTRCVCGWVLREQLAKAAGVDASDITLDMEMYVPSACARVFGGEYDEWSNLYHGVVDEDIAPTIERALMLRVLEAVQ